MASNRDILALLPKILHQGLEKKPSASVLKLKGALLFVDIAGFSSIATTLQKGQNDAESAEMLTSHLNAYFSLLIAVVDRFFGDIIFFSGDAMMVAWEGCEELSSKAALLCGSTLLVEAEEYSFSVGDCGDVTQCTMKLHMGAACGEFCGMTVGGRGSTLLGKWKYLITGVPVEVSTLAASLGGNSSLVFTADMRSKTEPLCYTTTTIFRMIHNQNTLFHVFENGTLQNAKNQVEVGKVMEYIERRNKVDPVLSKQGKVHAGLYVFDTVLKAAENTMSKFSGALRTVCTVFIKLASISCDAHPNDLHSRLNHCVGAIQKALAQYDGILNKIMLDDKGVICLCLFGIPLHGHSNDAYRGVLFAMRAAKDLKKNHHTIAAFGISYAPVFCGMTGSHLRQEYTVLGDGVNIAARLMCLAADFDASNYSILAEMSISLCKDMDKIKANGVAILTGDTLVLKGQEAPLQTVHIVREAERERIFEMLMGDQTSSGHSSQKSRAQSRTSLASADSCTSQKLRSRTATAYILDSKREVRKSRCSEISEDATENEWMKSCSEYSATLKSPVVSCHSSPRSLSVCNTADFASACERATAGRNDARSSCASSHSDRVARSPRNQGRKRLQSAKRRKLPHDFDEEESESDGLSAMGTDLKLHGRHEETSDIALHIAEWLDDDSPVNCVLLSGEPRIGKTYIMTSVLNDTAPRHLNITCAESQMMSQFNCIRILIEKVLLEHDVATVLENFPPHLEEAVPLLHFVLRRCDIQTPSLGVLARLEAEPHLLHQVIAEIFLFCAQCGKLVICIDDIQWLDGCSADAIAYLLTLPSFFILAAQAKDPLKREQVEVATSATRSTFDSYVSVDSDDPYSLLYTETVKGAEAFMEGLLASRNTMLIHVLPLQYDALVDVLQDERRCTHIDARLARSLYEKSDGFPGIAIEMLLSLIKSSLVSKNLTGKLCLHLECDLDTQLAQVVPPSLQASVMRNIDRLNPIERHVVSVAAVLGCSVPKALLFSCLGIDGIAFVQAGEVIESLCDMGLLALEEKRKGKRRKEARPRSKSGGAPLRPSILSPKGRHSRRESLKTNAQLLSSKAIDVRVCFQFSAVRDVIYNTILVSQRQRLHEVAADVILKSSSPALPFVVQHFRLAKAFRVGWQFVALLFKSHIKQGEYREGIRLLAELVTTFNETSKQTVSSIDGLDFGSPSSFVRSEWLMWLCLCLYESGHLGAAAVSAARMTTKPSDPPAVCSYAEAQACLSRKASALTLDSFSFSSDPSSHISLTKEMTLSRASSKASLLSNQNSDFFTITSPTHPPPLLCKLDDDNPLKTDEEITESGKDEEEEEEEEEEVIEKKPSPKKKKISEKPKKQKKRKKKKTSWWQCLCCQDGGEDLVETNQDKEKEYSTQQKYELKEVKKKKKKHKSKMKKTPLRQTSNAWWEKTPPSSPPPHPSVLRTPTLSFSSPGTLPIKAHPNPKSPSVQKVIKFDTGVAASDEDEDAKEKDDCESVSSHLSSSSRSGASPELSAKVAPLVTAHPHLSDASFVWSQLCMLNIELAFFGSQETLQESLAMLSTASQGILSLVVLQEALAVLKCSPAGKKGQNVNEMFQSSIHIMALCARDDALECLEVGDEALSLGSTDNVNLLPLQVQVYAAPTRPSCVATLLLCRSILKMFKGDGIGAFADCISFKNHRFCDERSVYYVCILRSLAALWYSEALLFPAAEGHWSPLGLPDIENGAKSKMFGDEILRLLFLVREGSAEAEKVFSHTSYFCPYHVLALVMILDDFKLMAVDKPAELGKLLKILQNVSEHMAFARPAFLYYKGLLTMEPEAHVECLKHFLEHHVEGDGISPFAFRAAAQLFSPDNGFSTPETNTIVAKVLDACGAKPGPLCSRLLEIGSQKFQTLPEQEMLKKAATGFRGRG